MKVGDLVKWAHEFNPGYYGGNADGLVVKINNYDDGTVIVDVLVGGCIRCWNSKSCEVVDESQ